jgi:hypothetical protein
MAVRFFESIAAFFRGSTAVRAPESRPLPRNCIPPNAPRISDGSNATNPSPCALRQRPSQGEGSARNYLPPNAPRISEGSGAMNPSSSALRQRPSQGEGSARNSLPTNVPRISGGSNAMNPSPFNVRQRPPQGEGSGSRSSASELLSTCMDTQAVVTWARRNEILEKDCNVLEAEGYTGRALLEPWSVVERHLYQDKVSRGGIALLRKLAGESNDPRGAWRPPLMPPPPNTVTRTLPPTAAPRLVAEDKTIIISDQDGSLALVTFADQTGFAAYLASLNASGLIFVSEEDDEPHDSECSPPPSPPSATPRSAIVHTTHGQLKKGGEYTIQESKNSTLHTLSRTVANSKNAVTNLADAFEESVSTLPYATDRDASCPPRARPTAPALAGRPETRLRSSLSTGSRTLLWEIVRWPSRPRPINRLMVCSRSPQVTHRSRISSLSWRRS